MAEKPKGNIIFEILIVILIAGLLIAILYPAHIWKAEEEKEDICQARMSAIWEIQNQFIALTETRTYTDSLDYLLEVVFEHDRAVSILDTLVEWDRLTTRKQIEEMVLNLNMPEDLRNAIYSRFEMKYPLVNLIQWGTLGQHLASDFKTMLEDSNVNEMYSVLDTSINWSRLIGDSRLSRIIDEAGAPVSISREARRIIQQRRQPLHQIRGWARYFREPVYAELYEIVNNASQVDVWTEDQEGEWEIARRAEWEENMDALSQAERDSLWETNNRRFWDTEREVYWMRDNKRLWRNEKEAYLTESRDIWERNLRETWIRQRRRDWMEERERELRNTDVPDSVLVFFETNKDSLWRAIRDSVSQVEFPKWIEDHEEEVLERVQNLWSSQRRLTWDEEAYAQWLEEQESSPDFWQNIKNRLWQQERHKLWREEIEKLAEKRRAIMDLDQNVGWIDVFGQDYILELINNLDLPDSEELLRLVQESNRPWGSRLYGLGIQSLLREALLDSVVFCPVSHTLYRIDVDDTSSVNRIDIKCPIFIDTDNLVKAESIDPVTGQVDTIELKLPAMVKLFGGGEINPHGSILNGDRTWE